MSKSWKPCLQFCLRVCTYIYIYLKLKDLNVIGPFWFWKEPRFGQWPFRGSGKSKISKYFNERTVCRFTLLLSSSDSRRFPTSTYGIQNDIVEANRSVDVAVLACFFIFLLPSDFLLVGTNTTSKHWKTIRGIGPPPLSLSLSLSANFFKSQQNTTEYKLRFLRTRTAILKQNFSLVFLTTLLCFCLRVPRNCLLFASAASPLTNVSFLCLVPERAEEKKKKRILHAFSSNFFFF